MAFSMLRRNVDYDKFLDQYKANLALQISNNNRIYNAVSQTNQGIQLPEAPPDMRSLAEKIGDIQNLKNQMSILLRQITDGGNADEIVNKLSDDELARAVQYFPALSAKLKSSYALGVPAEVFIQALGNYSELQDENAGIDMGLQGLKSTSDKILLSLKNIADYGLKPASILRLTSFGKQKKIINSVQTGTLADLEKIMLSLDDLQRISQMPIEDKNEIEKQLTEIYPKLPSQQQFDNAFARLQMIDDDTERKEAFDDMMRNLALTSGEIETLRQYRGVKTRGGLRITGKQAVRMRKESKKMEKEMKAKQEADEPVAPKREPLMRMKSTDIDLSSWKAVLSQLRGSSQSRYNVLEKIENANVGEFTYDNKPISLIKLSTGRIPDVEMVAGAYKTYKYWKATNVEELYNKLPKQEGKEGQGEGIMRGSGLVPKVKKERKVKAIRMTGQIEKPNEYVPFGRYGIHRFKLNDGILMLRTKSNNTIPALSPQKVSRNIVDILKQIIIGGIPSFEAISSLDASDKELLHKIVKLSHIDLSVPIPDLTQREKDNHRFQVLRGQLIAGNTSQDIIRELKTLLMKFIATGTIPKQQANAVLYELMILSK